MNDLRKAAGEALEALEALEDVPYMSNKDDYERLERVKTALRQVLVDADDTSENHVDETVKSEHEPVAEIQAEDMGKPFNAIRVTVHFYAEVPAVGTKLYTAPPKQWVGLTDEECREIFDACETTDRGYVLAMVEAKLKEKNKW
jgi:hypothetical protein